MDLTATFALPIPPTQDGTAALPAEILLKSAARLAGDVVTLKVNGADKCQITSAGARFNVPILPAGDFPTRGPIGADGEVRRFEMPAADLYRLLQRTAFAASDEETRYYLCGVHLADVGGELRAAATNGHRLSKATMDLPPGAEGLNVIVSSKSVDALLKALKDSALPVKLAASEHRLVAEIGGTTIDTRLIAGTFPDIERVIPPGHDKILKLQVKAFRAALEAARAVNKVVTIAVSDGGVVEIVAQDNGSDARIQLEALSLHPLEVGFNSTYLLSMLADLVSEEVTLELDPFGPAIVRDSGDERWLGIVMPMRV